MSAGSSPENCPRCGEQSAVRPKLLLIDEAWIPGPGKDVREKYHADLRVTEMKNDHLRARPLEQFVDGYYCDKCGQGFVPTSNLDPLRTRYR